MPEFTKKQLAIYLSQLKAFENPDIKSEQYTTDSNVAADVLWHALMSGDIEDKTIADCGAGTGILGIAALHLGAQKVYFVERDHNAIVTLKENLEDVPGDYEIIHSNVTEFTTPVDCVIQNPPFGTKQVHADKVFLEHAMTLAPKIYSLHKLSTEKFVRAVCRDHSYALIECMPFAYPLKNTHSSHTRKIHRIEVGCFIMRREA